MLQFVMFHVLCMYWYVYRDRYLKKQDTTKENMHKI